MSVASSPDGAHAQPPHDRLDDVAEAAAGAAAAAEAAFDDARSAAQSAAHAKDEATLAETVAAALASRAREVTADLVATAAIATAELAAATAAAVATGAVAQALDAARAAVLALEAVHAQLPPDADPEDARRAAASIATDVAKEVVAQAKATADAAATVAMAVETAAHVAGVAAATAATALEQDSAVAAAAGGVLTDSIAATAAAADVVAASTEHVVDLTTHLRTIAALRVSEERFSVIFEDSPLAMSLILLDGAQPGRVLKVNRWMRELTGRSEEALLGLVWGDLVHADNRDYLATLLPNMAGGATSDSQSEARLTHADGRNLWVRVWLHRLRSDSLAAYAVGQIEDITARRRSEATLRAQEERFRLAFDNAVTGMMFLGLDGTLRSANEALLQFLGYREADVAGHHVNTLVCTEEQARMRTGVADLASGAIGGYQAEHRFESMDGCTTAWGMVSGALADDSDGEPAYLVFQVRDITARKNAEFALSHQALHDALTGLPNRLLLTDRLDRARARSERHGTHVAVVFIDLDDFKEVNDGLGHAAGDEVLVEFGRRLVASLRDNDTACRWGGDEFVVVCDDLSDPQDVGIVIDRINSALAVPFTVAATELTMTASIGVATNDDGTADADTLLRGADLAMFRAKDLGKNRHEVYNPDMLAAAHGRVALARELEAALVHGELRLHYQPMFSIATGAMVGVEALLRWQHPTRGLLGPAHFLDVAESHRLMIPIGAWVFATAVAQAATWQRAVGPSAPDMWVNISGQQLGQQHLTDVVESTLAATGLMPAKLGIEITERHLVGENDHVHSDLLALKALGVRLAVDDFGTGYGSFEYLRRFPIDEIKIDVSFISGLGIDRTDTAVTSAIVALGCSLDLVVVGEGVETQDQHDRLKALGCHISQGYLWHRPAPPDAIDLLLGV